MVYNVRRIGRLPASHVLFGARASSANCSVHETSVTRYGISKSTYPLERFQKPRYVPRDSGRKVPEDAVGGPWRSRGETCCEGGGCTPMGPATKSKISVTLSSPLGCEQGSHMRFSPRFGKHHGRNSRTRLVIEKDADGHANPPHRAHSDRLAWPRARQSSTAVDDTGNVFAAYVYIIHKSGAR